MVDLVSTLKSFAICSQPYHCYETGRKRYIRSSASSRRRACGTAALLSWLCARDRAGLRPPVSHAAPRPRRLSGIRPIKKALTAKLDMIAKFAGKFLLETRGPLARNTMLSRAPARGWTFTGQ